jgi:ABC-type transport system substrate-binding protein
MALLRPALAAVLLGSLALTACSSSSGSSATSPSAAPAASSPAVAGSAPAASSAGTATSADAATTAAVTKAYETFFNYKTGAAASQQYLQLGDKFAPALAQQAKTAAAQKISVKVSKVELQSPHIAKVTFTLYGGTNALLPNNPGLAVMEDGSWKVAAQTFCALVQIQGAAPPQCQDPAVASPSP